MEFNEYESLPILPELREDAAAISEILASPDLLEEGDVEEWKAELEELNTRIAILNAISGQIQKSHDLKDSKVTHPSNKRKLTTDPAELLWLRSTAPETVLATKIETPSLDYWFTDLTKMHRVTSTLSEKLEKQGELEVLTNKLTSEGIPIFWGKLKSGDFSIRPISIGHRNASSVKAARSFNCRLPAYKLDVQGTNNRAIIVLMGASKEGIEQIGLAAIYDHDDDMAIHRSLFLKNQGKRG